MTKLSDIFSVEYPKTMILNRQTMDAKGVRFVSSTGQRNGVAARISQTDRAKKYPGGAITVAMKGSVLSSFVQSEDFYIAHQIAVLYPKEEMSLAEKLFYCVAIETNRYRFNYGRQADRTLKDLKLPSRDEVPDWVEPNFEEVLSGFKERVDALQPDTD
jgi:hypothetical protein